jgi:hypothetical protein
VWEVVLGKGSDQIEVVIDESGGAQVAEQSGAALVDLGKYELERLHLQLYFLLALKDVGIAGAADDSSIGRGLVSNEHIGDFLGVLQACKLDLRGLVNYLLPYIFVHTNIINLINVPQSSNYRICSNIPYDFGRDCRSQL